MYLPKASRKGATDWSMPMPTALNSFGVDGGLSPMWCETGTCASSIASHTPSMAMLAKSIGRFSRSLPGESGIRNVFRSERLQLVRASGERRPRPTS